MTNGVRRSYCIGAGVVVLICACSADAPAYEIVNRWSGTQIDGGGLLRGDPVTLRWSIVPDGQAYSRSANSQVIDFLDDGWNVPAAQRTPNLTNRSWWTVINNAYAQFARVSGISLVYVAEQSPTGASTGMVGDIRIGGDFIDQWTGGILADNTYPNDGDMRLDIRREANGAIGGFFNTEPGLRNLVIHETGHGVGLGHAEFIRNSAKSIMEPGLRLDIWGLQFDDVYALNRQYGDPRERSGGNNSANTASHLGNLGTTGSITIGTDAVDSMVQQFDDDWVGIDGTSDVDWFRFSVTDQSFANISLSPIGPTYATEVQGLFNSAAMSDLSMEIFRASPVVSPLRLINSTGIGTAESVTAMTLTTAGDYLVRVRGAQNANQFYQLGIAVRELPISGTSGDLNFDGFTDAQDWQLFRYNILTDLTGLSSKEAYKRGDLDFDGDNDSSDFNWFRTSYDFVNGPGTFDMQIQIPEPGTAVGMLALLSCSALFTPRRFAGLRRVTRIGQHKAPV